jgi:ABC-type nitrate/sulfonate/bicarbonate transport system substrate-binding protein
LARSDVRFGIPPGQTEQCHREGPLVFKNAATTPPVPALDVSSRRHIAQKEEQMSIKPNRRVRAVGLAVASLCTVSLVATACSSSGGGASSSSKGGLKGSRFTLMLQSTPNANKVVEVHAVNLLKAQGVNTSLKWNSSTPNIAATELKSGSIDAWSEAVTGAVGVIQGGVAMEDFALAQPRQDYVFLAKPGINSLADLKGKKIGVQDTTGVNYAQALLVLGKAGLSAGDVSMVATGGQATRLPALLAGRIDATMLSHSAELKLAPKGYKTLFDYTKDASNLYDDNVFATAGWLSKNKELATAFNKALLDSFAWFDNPANKDAVVSEALAIDPGADKAATATLFDMLRTAGAYPTGTILDANSLDQQQQLYKQAGALTATVPVSQWVDDSFAKAAKGS